MRRFTGADTAKPVTTARSSDDGCRWASLIAFAVPFAFALFTNHVWEDYYITFRASRNLAEGHGLVYQIGERVHPFTSPLGVLLPALFFSLTHSDVATLWCFRLLCCAALAGTAATLWKLLEERKVSVAGRWLVTLLLVGESKLVDFTINGMETPLVLFLGATLLRLLLRAQAPRPIWLGATMAGLMWTRPDAFVLSFAMIGAVSLLEVRSRIKAVDWVKLLSQAGLWAFVLYGPWLAWAWWYYGSPIPHTIVAKSGALPDFSAGTYWIKAPFDYLTGRSSMVDLINPTYRFFGGWPKGLIQFGHALAIIAGFIWLVPKLPRVTRIASLALFFGSYYLQAIPPAPWYFPPWSGLAAVALGTAAGVWLDQTCQGSFRRSFARCAVGIILVVQLTTVGLVAWQMRQQQEIIEIKGRRAIGKWLAERGTKTDTVFLEPLGYIGYFSQLHMLDYPGLSAPSVTAAMREVGPDFADLITKLQPTWLVLRPQEVGGHGFGRSKILDEYDYVRGWDLRPAIDRVSLLPGRDWLEVDAIFYVYHRRLTQ